jgi:hypothetical protein
LKGKVTPKAFGKFKPGSALDAAKILAAGTAICDAPAARIAKINPLMSVFISS